MHFGHNPRIEIRMWRTLLLIAVICLSGRAAARDALGVFEGWAAFRDAAPARCYAITEPDGARRGEAHRPFLSVAIWPVRDRRPQVHVRLRRDRPRGTPVFLETGGARFLLVAGRADAWARDSRADAAIVRAMRGGDWLRVIARDERGRRFTDAYRLAGAATAIDAAIVGCTRRR